jgi:hypothetical protein
MCSKFDSLSDAQLLHLAYLEALNGDIYQFEAAFALADRGIVPQCIDLSVGSFDDHLFEPNPGDTATQSSTVVAQNVLQEPRADSRPLVSCMAGSGSAKEKKSCHVHFVFPEDASSQSIGPDSDDDEKAIDESTAFINEQWNS